MSYFDYEKDPGETLRIAFNFGTTLDDDDTVASVSEVVITRETRGFWKDVSDEFGDPTGSEADDVVTLTLGEAAAGEQPAGHQYRIRVKVVTDGGETLYGVAKLQITSEGAPS